MERDHNISLKKSLRENSIYGSKKAMKDPWSFEDLQDHDYLLGFSWPPRSYTCNFCKREFRSAQALGGHMNVHRRDRARLRLQQSSSPSPPPPNFTTGSSSFLNPNPNPIPNPNFSPSSLMGSSSSSSPLPLIPPLSSSSPSSLSGRTGQEKAYLADSLSPRFFKEYSSIKNVQRHIKPSLAAVEEVKGLTRNDSCKFLKKGTEIISLELEIGLVHDSEQELDLELRLGLA